MDCCGDVDEGHEDHGDHGELLVVSLEGTLCVPFDYSVVHPEEPVIDCSYRTSRCDWEKQIDSLSVKR